VDDVGQGNASDLLRVVLVTPRNPLNIGAAARAMSNFGFPDLALVRPYDVAFQEARSAVRSKYILEQARVFDTVGEAVADCTLVVGTTAVGHRDLRLPLYRLEPAGDILRQHLAGSRAALLFGSEKFGLSNEDMSFCHWLLRVPARVEHGSMNLGQAVAICLYELRREEALVEQRFSNPRQATAGEYENVTGLLVDILKRSGYVNERTSQSTELKIRRLVGRLGIPSSDVENWLGVLRQILWKIKQDGSD
jgi:TrmH family RNA methyltransferase